MAMTYIHLNIATPLSGAENIILVVFLSLMLEPETGCGYGKVSNTSILGKVHLQGKNVMMTAWGSYHEHENVSSCTCKSFQLW